MNIVLTWVQTSVTKQHSQLYILFDFIKGEGTQHPLLFMPPLIITMTFWGYCVSNALVYIGYLKSHLIGHVIFYFLDRPTKSGKSGTHS